MLTYLLIKTKHGKNRIAHDKIAKYEEFLDIHEVYGRYDIIALAETADLNELRTFIQNKLWIVEDIMDVETSIVSQLEEADASEESEIPAEPASTDNEPEELEDGQYLPA